MWKSAVWEVGDSEWFGGFTCLEVSDGFVETNIPADDDFSDERVVASIGLALFIIAYKDSRKGFGVEFCSFGIRDMVVSNASDDSKMAEIRLDSCVGFLRCLEFQSFGR